LTTEIQATPSTRQGEERPLLEVQGLRFHFRTEEGTVRAVDGVSFSLAPGEILGVVGESGSGKSVTQLALMGLLPQPPGVLAGGAALFEGQDLVRMPAQALRALRGNRISMIFQDPMTSLNPFLKVSRQLEEVLEIHTALGKAERREKGIEMLRKVGIPDPARRYDQYPHQFSGGMRQRVMIAMALLCSPRLLIADEPTTALDVTIQAQILELIQGLRRDLGTSVILITHDLGVVAGVSDRIMVMYAGRVMEKAATKTIFKETAHPYTIGLLRSVPRLDTGGGRARLVPIPGLPPNVARPLPGCPFADRCPFTQERCQQAFPERQELSPGHEVFCWRAEEIQAMSAEARDEAARRKAAQMSQGGQA
jgi:oligopeptide transport system ATP-binding protein